MKKYTISIGLIILLGLGGCQDEWLEIKRDKEQVIPQTLDELQALLDNTSIMNLNGPYLGETGSTDIFLEYDWLLKATPISRNTFLWKKDVYEGQQVLDWEYSYERILYSNLVLDGLKKIENSEARNQVQGRALFYRAWNYYQMAQIFCRPYNSSTASADLGLPLKREADITLPVNRATLAETYEQIINDLTSAVSLLPEKPLYNTRPGKVSAYALLAKTYLQMSIYDLALENVQRAMAIQSELLDFNDLDPEGVYPLENNKEVIFYAQMSAVFPIADYPYWSVNTELFDSYENGDLRRDYFFRGDANSGGFRGSYSDNGYYFFMGIATDELYLIRAECSARLNMTEQTMSDLNYLLSQRYSNDLFTPVHTSDANEALAMILKERQKELVFRGIRWADLRRLNQDPALAITLTRELNNEVYQLPPNDPRYTLPIPEIVIQLSGIEQNER